MLILDMRNLRLAQGSTQVHEQANGCFMCVASAWNLALPPSSIVISGEFSLSLSLLSLKRNQRKRFVQHQLWSGRQNNTSLPPKFPCLNGPCPGPL